MAVKKKECRFEIKSEGEGSFNRVVRTLHASPQYACSVCKQELRKPAYYCAYLKEAWHEDCFLKPSWRGGVPFNHWAGQQREHTDYSVDSMQTLREGGKDDKREKI